MELIGNSVRIRSCPRNCKLCRKIYFPDPFVYLMPLCAAAYGKATKVERARRPAYFINYDYLKLSGERLGWIYDIIHLYYFC